MARSKKIGPFDPDVIRQGQQDFSDSLKGESDRGLVLVCLAYLDEKLELLLRTHFTFEKKTGGGEPSNNRNFKKASDELFGSYRPLSTFSAKLNLAYLLGLISEWEFQDIEAANQVRNKFAHQIKSANFRDENVATLVKRFVDGDTDQQNRFKTKVGYMGMLIIARVVILEGDLTPERKRLGMTFPNKSRFSFHHP